MFRLLKAEEIDVRVGGVTKDSGGFLLLYKDARCDMNILDETYGVLGWQRTHELIDGQLFCNVSIYDDMKETWVTKQDVGVESYSDKEKGRASDSFKRACFNLGIGRELYTAPFIWISDKQATKENWKYKKYKVKDIGYDDARRINRLVIVELIRGSENIVFEYGVRARNNQVKTLTSDDFVDRIMDYAEKNNIEDVMLQAFATNLGIETLAGISKKNYEALMSAMTEYVSSLGG